MTFASAGTTSSLLSGKGKQRALEPSPFLPTSAAAAPTNNRGVISKPSSEPSRLRRTSPYTAQVDSKWCLWSFTTRGTRPYQEDTASVSCIHMPVDELRRNYLKGHSSASSPAGAGAANAALEWDPEKAGWEELAGQVVWFGCLTVTEDRGFRASCVISCIRRLRV